MSFSPIPYYHLDFYYLDYYCLTVVNYGSYSVSFAQQTFPPDSHFDHLFIPLLSGDLKKSCFGKVVEPDCSGFKRQ